MSRGVLLAWLWVSACSFAAKVPGTEEAPTDAPAVPDADPDVPPEDLHLRVEALIDGESHLVIKGKTLYWRHFIYAAPGRWDADGAAPFTELPIAVNGVDWYPTWPDQPNPENRSCNGCESSTYELPVGVPRVPSTTTWTEVQTRRAQGIVQYPSADNDWELIVLISDYGVGGAAAYVVDIDVVVDGS